MPLGPEYSCAEQLAAVRCLKNRQHKAVLISCTSIVTRWTTARVS